jgi:hypothetical protein
MNTAVATAAIQVLRDEAQRILARFEADDPEQGYERWLWEGQRFIADLALSILLAIHHEIERDLVLLAARSRDNGRRLTVAEYQERVKQERESLKGSKGHKALVTRLGLMTLADWRSIELLRLLSNSYKHNPEAEPDSKLLAFLYLERGVPYAPIAESDAVRKGLLTFLDLPDEGDFCDVADELLTRSARFVASAAAAQSNLSAIDPRVTSMNPATWPR